MVNGVTAINVGITVGMVMGPLKEEHGEKLSIVTTHGMVAINRMAGVWSEQIYVTVDDEQINLTHYRFNQYGAQVFDSHKTYGDMDSFERFLRASTAKWSQKDPTMSTEVEEDGCIVYSVETEEVGRYKVRDYTNTEDPSPIATLHVMSPRGMGGSEYLNSPDDVRKAIGHIEGTVWLTQEQKDFLIKGLDATI